ncbi:MAG TPA: outer membrane protein assembly factor BamD [Pyrinomonadaceae bacterium]|nr:outer membrane protein assembly factor BamD [Chloracidobacterium sp.]MBP9936329.1 outer membrane protein assembly factor BamD [Pyrinomonadaceae bacterium]MBK7802965.1 outer membrane protein assembly factor BamD [Chloracidobacterium sp.]MBK9438383.1 outer membrane protein assembly factor BamD [Chloracidobacterium sp.]MBK9767929.1 outer membrane protein assembly factor BamD [Chloracidobacterium sp.]
MKTKSLLFAVIILGTLTLGTFAQRNVTPAIDRDPLMEADAKHNLDVAWQAFGPARKAYKQVLLRFEETFAAYPEFSKIDEFLYLAGMSSYYLSENKGKQKIDYKSEKEKVKFAPAKLREDAVMYFGMLVEKYPQSKYKADAETTLTVLKSK